MSASFTTAGGTGSSSGGGSCSDPALMSGVRTDGNTAFWGRTYGARPASNPSPSRGASTSAASISGGGGGSSSRSMTPGRSAVTQQSWGYSTTTRCSSSGSGGGSEFINSGSGRAVLQGQLGGLFTARAMHSPYLQRTSSSKATHAAQSSTAYSPKVRQ